jgi:hypothetical protein
MKAIDRLSRAANAAARASNDVNWVVRHTAKAWSISAIFWRVALIGGGTLGSRSSKVCIQ